MMMKPVFEEIKNNIFVRSDDLTQLRTTDLLSFGGHIDTISSEDYHILGVSNEIGKDLLYEPENEYMGKKYTRTYLLKAKNYQSYQYINIEAFLYDDIVGFETINGEVYYELATCDTIDRIKATRRYRKLPRRKRSYIINTKTKKCTCDNSVIHGDCEHARKINLNNLSLVFRNKLGLQVAEDICGMCE